MARVSVPRDSDNDYTHEAAAARRAFLSERTGGELHHVGSFSVDPAATAGNVEHFIGVAQVPIGVAGPLLVNGEEARGEFYVPLATAEGTLVASYNRGMKLLYEAGGVTTTVLDDRMQRAPAFVFPSAREARAFGDWLQEHFDAIKLAAEATTRSGRLKDIETYSASRILFTRFNYTTGDAAGQNLTGKATAAACAWIMENHPGIEHFFLESNFATDKKSSQVNMLRTRGKRVVAEATIPDELFRSVMNSSTEVMFRARSRSRRSSSPRTAAGPACRRSASAWSCSAATGPTRSASWPRSWRRRCCAGSCRSARRSWPRSGSGRTICSDATAPSAVA